jgi:hypothetical protein
MKKSNLPMTRDDGLSAKFRAAIDGTKAILIFGSAMLNKEAELEADWHDANTLRTWLADNCPEIDYAVARRLYQRAEGIHKSLGLTKDADLGGLLQANPRKLTADERTFRRTVEDLIEGRGAGQMRFEFDFNLKTNVPDDADGKPSESKRDAAEAKSARSELLSAIDNLTRGGKEFPKMSDWFGRLACAVMLFAAGMPDKAAAVAKVGSPVLTQEEGWGAAIALLLKNVGRLQPADAWLVRAMLAQAAGD